MKIAFTLLLALITIASSAQEVFKDGKKYGVSRYGNIPDKENGDSLMFRAEFDEIVPLDNSISEDFVFKALRNDEWSFLTKNKIVNQQRYESIVTSDYYPNYAVAFREGYIDVFSAESNDFLIRNVKAENLEIQDKFDNEALMMTHAGKEFYGLINIADKKEVLKCEYTRIYANYDFPETFIAFKDGITYLHQIDGELIFKLESVHDIFDIHEHDLVDGMYEITASDKKGNKVGTYFPKEKWFIQPIYNEITFIEDDPAVAIVTTDKGKGLYFEGKQIVPCEYLDIRKGDKQGTVAIVTSKKGDFYVLPEGQLKPKK